MAEEMAATEVKTMAAATEVETMVAVTAAEVATAAAERMAAARKGNSIVVWIESEPQYPEPAPVLRQQTATALAPALSMPSIAVPLAPLVEAVVAIAA